MEHGKAEGRQDPPILAKRTQVILVGTSHIAKQSVEHIHKVFEKEQPTIVCVELDRQRFHALTTEQKPKMSFRAIGRVGMSGFLFSLIGGMIQKRLGKFVGLEPGADMLSAINQAKAHNAKVALIDQDIERTLRRFSEEFTFKEKMRMLADMGKGLLFPRREMEQLGIGKLDLTKVPERELIDALVKRMQERYPGLYKTLIHERNEVMVGNVLRICSQHPGETVLVVVGAGHEKGMKAMLDARASPAG